ncbi:MAG: hypothetical protein M1489_02575 [Firmicutes bacterium]|nr:hypothetical protein [Bacillota bacterium]
MQAGPEDNPRDGQNANPPDRRSQAEWRYPKDDKRFFILCRRRDSGMVVYPEHLKLGTFLRFKE